MAHYPFVVHKNPVAFCGLHRRTLNSTLMRKKNCLNRGCSHLRINWRHKRWGSPTWRKLWHALQEKPLEKKQLVQQGRV